MKRNKKLLVSFLALNAVLTSYGQAETVQSARYERMYNNVVKNIEKGSTNEKTYQTIERILKQKNKELKDLYQQGDYIVKPEYLEWQVFFTGFYEEHGKGLDNSKENAQYHTKVSGYYDADGDYVTTSGSINGLTGKRYQPLQKPKDINFGVYVPMKGITKDPLDLSLTPVGEISINPGSQNIKVPNGIVKQPINTYKFEFNAPEINPPTITTPPFFNVKPPSTGNADETYLALRPGDVGTTYGKYRGYTAMISQYNLSSGIMKAYYESTGYLSTAAGGLPATTTGGYLSSYEIFNLLGIRDYNPGFGDQYGNTTVLDLADIDPSGLTITSTPGLDSGQITALYKITAAEEITLGTKGNVNSLIMEIISNLPTNYTGSMPHLIQYDPHVAGGSIFRYGYKPYLKDHFGNSVSEIVGDGAPTRYGELINYGTIKGSGNSLLLLGLQSHNGKHSPTYKNYGLMLGEYNTTDFGALGGTRHVGHAFTAKESNPDNRRYEFYNMEGGRIEMQASESIGYYYGEVNVPTFHPHYNIFNDGEIVLYGQQNVGIKTAGASDELTYSKIVLNNPIKINGDKSVGIEIAKLMDDGYGSTENPSGSSTTYDLQPAVIKVLIGDEINKYSGNATGSNLGGLPYNSNFVEDSIGLFINKDTLFYRLKKFDFQFGANAMYSTLVNISNGHLFLDNIDVPDIDIIAGQNNFGIITTGSQSELTLRPNIKIGTTISAVDNTVALYGENGAKIHLDAANNIETNGDASHGIMLNGTNTFLNDTTSGSNHSFITTGDNSSALYVRDNATADLSNSSIINVKSTGDKSIGVYNDGGTVKLGTGSGDYEIGTNGILFFNDKRGINVGTIETSGVNFTVGDGSLFTRITFPSTTSGNEQIKFTHIGDTSLNLLNGGTGFIFTGNGAPADLNSIRDYFKYNYSGLNKMNVTVNSGSRLFIIEKYSTINLSDISAISEPTGIFKNIYNLGGKTAFLLSGQLILNPVSGTISLDDPNEIYNNIDRALTGVTVNTGVSLNGYSDNQIAILDDNSYESTLYVNHINNGSINLTGNSSTGIYANRGTITNNGLLNITGENGIGLFGENSTVISNTHIVTIGDKGVGIYGISYQNPSGTLPVEGNGSIVITNSGLIEANTGIDAIGIYADNNKISSSSTTSNINLSTGTINVSNSIGGIGVFVNNGTVTDSASTITVGKNGIGLYAKDSNITLTGSTINLNGDNALGIYLDGTTSFSGTGTINISGQNIVLFNMASSGILSNNFNIGHVDPGSSYILGNIVNGVFEYTGIGTLASNGALVSGKYSAVFLNGSNITVNSGSTGVAAIALDGQYTPTLLAPLPSSMTANTDGENTGAIVLEDSSVGMYGKNGSRFSNLGTITVRNSSAGMLTFGSGSSVQNAGTINLGSTSQGIYLKDGLTINNLSSGNILSHGAETVGVYSNNNTGFVTNNGNIDLSGEKSIGIYSIGMSNSIINNGTIKVGNSSNASDPSIGIYGAVVGSTVTNSGTVTSGINSIGIYNNGGTINNNGTSNVGNSGVGIYSTGGIVNLNGSTINMGANGAVGVYGVYSTVTNSTNLNIGNSNYGFILKGGSFTDSALMNNTVDKDSVYMYSTEGTTVVNNATLTMTASDNVGFYMAQDPVSGLGGGMIINNGTIIGTADKNNIGIYNFGGTVDNYGSVSVGSSDLLFVKKPDGTTELDIQNSKYAVGVYGENAAIVNHTGATITAGYGGYGIVAKGGTAVNRGTITTNGDYSTGMYTEGGVITNALGATITINGDNAIGMAGKGAGSHLINNGVINVNGDDSIAMYGNLGTIIANTGIINIIGNSQAFVSSDPTDPFHNVGGGTATINSTVDNTIQSIGSVHALPELINAGIIKSSGVLALDGVQVMIKPDPTTKQPSSDPDYDFELSGTSIIADEILTSKPIVILPGFADGTNANVYKLEGIINATSGKYDFISGSLLWEATPKSTGTGSDVYMSRKAFTDFTDGLWFEDFGTALENNYLTATGDGITIYNKTGYITNETDFRHIMASLAGNVYANINQREDDIAKTFENSLHLLQDSTNNTKENVKISVIAGKGKNKEETDGVVGYDYITTGVLALREVERTYKHTFGYSLGYVHTGFEFKDGNESEEWVDTIQLGVHNKYKANGWTLRNDLTGRASIHNVDRNIDWPSPLERSEMNGTYETYSITSDNILGKEFVLGKKASIMPYGAFRAMYVKRPTFEEKGLEALEVEGNDAWSAKPRAGVELKGAIPLGSKTAWQLKGTLDLAYEYELADLNEREKARLIAIEDGYHKLSKPEDEKGTFRTKAAIGVEVEDRYGIFLTGEYSTGNDKENDYRAGVTLKAVF